MIREASIKDIEQLVDIENRIFGPDKFSRRSLLYLLSKANATILVDVENKIIRGYAVILYNKGTSLARLYSLVVDNNYRRMGIAKKLLKMAEQDALKNDCVTLRLEVRSSNQNALMLYSSVGYKRFGLYKNYYKDQSDALRMEKHLVPHPKPEMVPVPFYQQTMEFTCGPAALIMAMGALTDTLEINRKLELKIWRESTTIFMTSGLGGCSPFGLALSAYQRGFDVELFVNNAENFFISSVRDPHKKEVIRLVQEDQLEQLAHLPIAIKYDVIKVKDLQDTFNAGRVPIVLISSYRIYHEKTPHWVVLTGYDEKFIYVHDSYVDHETGKTKADSINLPILKKDFERMSSYGKAGQKAVIIISRRNTVSHKI